jgi:hypothetical protein
LIDSLQHGGDPAITLATLFSSAIKAYTNWTLGHTSIDGLMPGVQNVNVDVNNEADFSERTAAVHENAEVFDPKTEAMFRYLQVLTLPVYVYSTVRPSDILESLSIDGID